MAVVAKIASEFDDAGVKAASKAFGDVRRTFKELSDNADDARGAGEKLGEAYSQAAERLKAELSNLQATSAVVADSLGPEMVQAMESSGRSVESYIQEWRKMGLTFDDIKADSEFLAQGLKDLDSAGRVAGENVGEGLRKVAHEGDQSRSVLANLVGNSVQDLGQLGGVAGSAGVMIGQLAEYAADGNIALGGLAKVAGPMVALTVGVAAITKVMEMLGERSKEVKEQTELLIGVQQDLADAEYHSAAVKLEEKYGDLIVTLKEYGFSTADVVKAIKGEIDLRPQLQKKIEENTLALMNGEVKWDNTRGKLEDAADTLGIAQEAFGNASTEITNTAEVTGELEKALGGGKKATEEATKATENAATANFDMVESIDAVVEAERRKKDAIMASIDANFAVFDATNNYKQSLDDLAKAVDDPKTSINEYDVALNDAARSALDAANAEADLAVEQAAREGVTLSADAKNKIMIDGLKKTAGALEKGSPLRVALEQYIAALSMVPADVSTAVRLMADVNVPTRYTGARAAGGPVAAGEPYLVGERGPEIVVPTSSSAVVPAGSTARMLGGGAQPIVVQLVMNDRTVQEIAIRADQLKVGRT